MVGSVLYMYIQILLYGTDVSTHNTGCSVQKMTQQSQRLASEEKGRTVSVSVNRSFFLGFFSASSIRFDGLALSAAGIGCLMSTGST